MKEVNPSARSAVNFNRFFTNVYLYLALGIGITALISYLVVDVYSYQVYSLLASVPYAFIILWGLQIGLVVYLGTLGMKNPTLSLIGFVAYSALTGVVVGVTVASYTGGTVMAAFASASITYVATALVGMTTKKDLSGMAHALINFLLGVIIAIFLNFFLLHSSAVDFFISLLMIGIFSGLTAYDHQKLKTIHAEYANQGAGVPQTVAMYCALQLYLDFINLFLAFLRIFSRR